MIHIMINIMMYRMEQMRVSNTFEAVVVLAAPADDANSGKNEKDDKNDGHDDGHS